MIKKSTFSLASVIIAGTFAIASPAATQAAGGCAQGNCPTASDHQNPSIINDPDKCRKAYENYQRAKWLIKHKIPGGDAAKPGGAAGWEQLGAEAEANARTQRQRAITNRARATEFPDQADFWNEQANQNDAEADNWRDAANRYKAHATGMRNEAKLHSAAALQAFDECLKLYVGYPTGPEYPISVHKSKPDASDNDGVKKLPRDENGNPVVDLPLG
ncbi:MAG: hypothetical protein HKN11_12535, partial [Rhizobiales bacterium]|nr:hypothetical protein [Hyphomicrobiales bacterium]